MITITSICWAAGTKDGLLCRMTAASTGVKIVAGPIEATAMGNAAVQLMTTGEIADLKAARAIIRNSFDTIESPGEPRGLGSCLREVQEGH